MRRRPAGRSIVARPRPKFPGAGYRPTFADCGFCRQVGGAWAKWGASTSTVSNAGEQQARLEDIGERWEKRQHLRHVPDDQGPAVDRAGTSSFPRSATETPPADRLFLDRGRDLVRPVLSDEPVHASASAPAAEPDPPDAADPITLARESALLPARIRPMVGQPNRKSWRTRLSGL